MARRVSAQNGMPIAIAGQTGGRIPRSSCSVTSLASWPRPALRKNAPACSAAPRSCAASRSDVVGGIVPWNYPQTLASFKYGPDLAAGCTIVPEALA